MAMARPKQTDLAILGGLSVEPMTGYRLRTEITEVLGHFWHESYGQIYPALARLEREGLISSTSGERTSSKVYALTTEGQKELRRRLAESPEHQQPRNALLLRVFFGANLAMEDLRRLLDDYEAELAAGLARFAGIRLAITGDPLSAVHGRYWLATVSAGEHAIRAQLEWLAETRRDLLA